MIAFHLPWPPTANMYWRHNRRRTHISDAGTAYREAVLAEVWSSSGKPDPLAGALGMSIRLSPPDRRRRDVDNVQKPILDALEAARVYDDDYQVSELHTFRGPPEPPGSVVVEIWQIQPARPDDEPEGEPEGRHPLAELIDSAQMLCDSDRVIGGKSHSDQARTAAEAMLSLARTIAMAANQIEVDLIAGRYSPLADPK